MPRVAIAQQDDIARAIEQALGHLDLEDLFAGKVVAVKPNETATPDGDTTGVTQADTLRAVLRHIKRFSPKGLIVTGGSGDAETEDVTTARSIRRHREGRRTMLRGEQRRFPQRTERAPGP